MQYIRLISLTLVFFITGCNDDGIISSCGDLPSGSNKFDITNVNVQVLLAPTTTPSSSRVSGDLYNQGTEVNYDDIVFSINAVTQVVAAKKKESKGFSFSLISSAYACSLLPPSTDEKIIDIKVTSSADFNNAFSAGDSLKSKFEVTYTESYARFFTYENEEKIYYNLIEYLEQDDVYAGKVIQFKLNEEPEFAGYHIFYIELMLSTGEIFLLETAEIRFAQ
ncbi:MAG: hypothetical protein ACI96W_002820 [Paraglaciecola sp.]|jgi:hypothetical protein